jgi:hypothetical protein
MNMRRRGYPFGRYLIKDKKAEDLGPLLGDFVQNQGFKIVKFSDKNEGKGTLIIAVNKKIKEFMKQKKPSGYLTTVLSGFSVPSFRETDYESQRVGIEMYLWPISEGILMEIFVLPYMEHFDKTEIYGLTETKTEEITDWYVCEHVWEEVVPKIVSEFDAELVHRRG